MFAAVNRMKLKTKNLILGWTFVAAVFFSPEAYKALLFVCIVWSVLYVGGTERPNAPYVERPHD